MSNKINAEEGFLQYFKQDIKNMHKGKSLQEIIRLAKR